ncbi:MAG: DNA polymerase III subunit chi [Pseudomonadota bacterium]
MQVGFYHCTRNAPLAVVPRLAAKAVAAGHRILVHAGPAADDVDEALWAFDPGSFLPHGRAGGDDDANQPILIADGFDGANAADLAIAMAGRLPGADAGFARVLYLFDGGDDDAVAAARRHWKALSARDDVEAVYWAEGERGWEKR